MAGFNRAPSAWPFEFNGFNATDAPDQLSPNQYPLAINVRALGNRYVQTRPGYSLLFTAESSPVIDTVCPIDAGEVDTPYEFEFEVTGGVPPYTWTITDGELPDGLTLDSSTGILSGTPTDYGTFSFTVRVTDALGHFDEVSCSITILPVTACGSFTTIAWRHNSRIGAFLGDTAGTVFYIGRSSANARRIEVWRSTEFGRAGSWSKIDDNFVTTAADIISFDCHEISDAVLVAVQETVGSGRVSFNIFSKTSWTWTLLDQEVVASCSIVSGDVNDNGGTVSVTQRTNGNYVVAYDTNVENVSGSNRFRYGVRESADGITWSGEMQSNQAGVATDFCLGRVIAYSDNSLRIISGNSDAPFFGHFYNQNLSATNVFGAIANYFTGGALSQVQQGRCVGDYAVWEESGTTKMLVPQRTLEDLRYAIFSATTSPDVNTLLSGDTCFIASATAACPQGSARYVGTSMHLMSSSFSNSVPTHFYHKQDDSTPFTAFLPGTNDQNQSGPIFSILGQGIPGQEHSAIVARIEGVDYYISLRDSGTAGLGMIFNWIKLDQLPTSASQTISVWSGECLS